MEFLTSEQAMADYAELLFELKDTLHAESSPVIGFGGSYGATSKPSQSLLFKHTHLQNQASILCRFCKL